MCAQNLAKNCGYAVFPCRLHSDPDINKRPACPRGLSDASSDQAEIARLWKRFPGELIGIRTGAASGIDVLDIDGPRHPIAFEWWEVARKRIPPTRTYLTQSGGLHAYFQHAGGVTNTASKLAEGVDTRGDGGYAISWWAAGCECVDHSVPAVWPAWLLECVLRQKPQIHATPIATRSSDQAGSGIDGIIRFLSESEEGERNRRLFWSACRLDECIEARKISRPNAKARLLEAAKDVGLSESEALRTLGSAWKVAA